MDNIPEELLFFGDISDDYLWLRSEQCCKSISFSFGAIIIYVN